MFCLLSYNFILFEIVVIFSIFFACTSCFSFFIVLFMYLFIIIIIIYYYYCLFYFKCFFVFFCGWKEAYGDVYRVGRSAGGRVPLR